MHHDTDISALVIPSLLTAAGGILTYMNFKLSQSDRVKDTNICKLDFEVPRDGTKTPFQLNVSKFEAYAEGLIFGELEEINSYRLIINEKDERREPRYHAKCINQEDVDRIKRTIRSPIKINLNVLAELINDDEFFTTVFVGGNPKNIKPARKL